MLHKRVGNGQQLTSSLARLLPFPINVDPNDLPKPTENFEVLKADLARFGFCYVKDALSPEEVLIARQRLLEQAEEERRLGVNPLDGKNQRVHFLVNKGQCFRDAITNPKTSAVVDALLGPRWILSSCQANIANPGSAPQMLHVDQGAQTHRRFTPSPHELIPPGYRGGDYLDKQMFARWESWMHLHERPSISEDELATLMCTSLRDAPSDVDPSFVCNVAWCLSDVSAANGGTLLVPGSHLTGVIPPYDLAKASPAFSKLCPTISAEAPAGTALIFDGRVWHGTGANTTTDEQRLVLLQYCASAHLRTQENYFLGLRPDVFEKEFHNGGKKGRKLLQKLGFKTSLIGGVLGKVEYSDKGIQKRWVKSEPGNLVGELRPIDPLTSKL